MTLTFSALAQAASDGGASFNPSTLGLAAVFLVMLGLLARAYLALQRELAAAHVAHALAMKAVVEEQTDTLKEIAVVLDRVQTGLSRTVERAREPGPDVTKVLEQLARNTDLMSRRLEGRGD